MPQDPTGLFSDDIFFFLFNCKYPSLVSQANPLWLAREQSEGVGPELRGRSWILLGLDDGECLFAAARQEGCGRKAAGLPLKSPVWSPVSQTSQVTENLFLESTADQPLDRISSPRVWARTEESTKTTADACLGRKRQVHILGTQRNYLFRAANEWHGRHMAHYITCSHYMFCLESASSCFLVWISKHAFQSLQRWLKYNPFFKNVMFQVIC